MKLSVTLLFALSLPRAFALPPQTQVYKRTIGEPAAVDVYALEHDARLMMKRGINAACVSAVVFYY
jgi:hypothetical protein